MGRLDVITATKVSRTAHDPAFCAPLTGSWEETLVSHYSDPASSRAGDTDGYDKNATQDACDGHKDAAREQQDETGLLEGLNEECHSIGIGMLIR